MKRARFEVFPTLGATDIGVAPISWNWRLRAANGRIVCWASRFNTKAGAKKAARRSQYILGGIRQLQIIEVEQ